jgi:myo-inositol-1(or 4)-monophosphatase
MDSHLDFAIELTRQAGELLLSYYRPGGTRASLKADRSLVTEADLAADQMISGAIRERYPQEALLSEELRQTLEGDDRCAWVVDPLDGTANFSLGLPMWGVSLAHLVDGYPEEGAIYFPALGELYTAQRGAGAALNSERIQVRPPDPDMPAAFFSCCSRTFRHYEVSIRYRARILGSACYTLCAVARGLALIGFEATPKLWDIAGGWLLVEEAGGSVMTHDGSQPFPLAAGLDYRGRNYPILAAATAELAARAKEQIRPRIEREPGS